MEVVYYNPVDEKGGCVVRSISKALNKDYLEVKKELPSNDEEVFENYLLKNNFIIDESLKGEKLRDLSFTGTNIVFGYNGDWYHMICIIDNTIYDKNTWEDLADLEVIKVYKKDE